MTGEELARPALSTSHMHTGLEGEERQILTMEAAHVVSTAGRAVAPWEAAGVAAHLAAEVCRRHVQDESRKLVPLDCVIRVRIRCCTAQHMQFRDISTNDSEMPAVTVLEVS